MGFKVSTFTFVKVESFMEEVSCFITKFESAADESFFAFKESVVCENEVLLSKNKIKRSLIIRQFKMVI